ncbi:MULTISPECIES: helix-turn-helix transcriptional regulator [unclassified Nocardioides]|uniref:helix-turn-helix transcriptional regulator n=1 Tax=unclassified Nocardioides TaxID=2615069 RepID=UPI00362150B5
MAGQFRLIVDTVSRSVAASARVQPVTLEAFGSMGGARDVVLRAKADLVVVVVAANDPIDVHDLISELDARGQRVLVVGQVREPHESAELIAAGALAVLDDGLTELVQLIEHHATGRRPPPAARRARGRATRARAELTEERRARRNLARLTGAEARILWRLMHGSSVAEIAEAHVVSIETVRSQIRALLAKLEASSQLAAVAVAWRVGWTPAPAALTAA